MYKEYLEKAMENVLDKQKIQDTCLVKQISIIEKSRDYFMVNFGKKFYKLIFKKKIFLIKYNKK